MKWSNYSEAIFSQFADSEDNIIVQACPGSGKTTNIKHLWTLTDKPTVYLVFGKANQVTATAALPQRQGSDVLTTHSLGARAIYKTFGKVTLDDKKVLGIIRDRRRGKFAGKEARGQEYMLAHSVSAVKGINTGEIFTVQAYNKMVSTYDLDEYPSMYEDTVNTLTASDNMTNVIDFADQIRFPLIYNCAMPEYHTVMGDEVQDFNPAEALLLKTLNAERYVLVGDTHQSIYGFKGAMNNGMSYLKESFNCTQMPLSISYRCAQAVVKEAALIYPDIEPWEDSPQGTVRRSLPERELYTSNDIILCRINRPLIDMAYDLLQRGIPCYVRGRDIGHGLIALIKRQDALNVRQLIAKLTAWYEREMAVACAREDETKLQRVEDKYGSVMIFCHRHDLDAPPEYVCSEIESLFNNGNGVCLSTVHRAKGLEADRCFLLAATWLKEYEAIAIQPWKAEQERNVRYVAVTRAKNELVYM